jgi:hypothetical protein
MWGLIIASGVCGLLFGRYFRVYSLVAAELVLAGITYFLASEQGWTIGVLSFVLATVAIQLCYFLSVVVRIFVENVEPAKAPSEEFLSLHRNRAKGRLSWRPLSIAIGRAGRRRQPRRHCASEVPPR